MIIRAALSLFLFIFSPVYAAEIYKDSQNSVELISGYDSTGGLIYYPVGLHFKFQKHWKTYYLFPGTAGYPLKIDITGSKNLKRVEIKWPAPEEFTVLGLKAYGYDREVILPVIVTPENPEQDVFLNLNLDYLICDPGNCIPKKVTLSTTVKSLDAAGEKKTVENEKYDLIKGYLDKEPTKDTGGGLTIDRVELDTTDPRYHTLIIHARNPDGLKNPLLIINPKSQVYVDFPEYEITRRMTKAIDFGKEMIIKANVYSNELKDAPPQESLIGKTICLVLEDDGKAVKVERVVSEITEGLTVFLITALFAFMGGFILNFMPCVLPVIFIKTIYLMEQHHNTPCEVRKNFLMTSAGIMLSFLLIALITVTLRQLGVAVGWGSQFQYPLFLVAIMLIILFFSLNLLGFFEIMLPSGVNTNLFKMQGGDSPMAHFFSGAFVTALATPCTAPFLGTALSFALTRSGFEVALIFISMGLGLSFPFLMLVIAPGLVRFIPRPGAWMNYLKKFLSVPLLLTLVWLMWTLYSIVGIEEVIVLSVLFVLIALMLIFKCRNLLRPFFCKVLMVLLVTGSLATPYVIESSATEKDLTGSIWVNFDEKQIRQLVAQGKTVFVDVTAEWCLTCKANENLVLKTKTIQDLLKRKDVQPMLADWTRGDLDITAFMRKFNRFAVPFYVVFGPKNPEGIILPEVLSVNIVQDAIAQASGSK